MRLRKFALPVSLLLLTSQFVRTAAAIGTEAYRNNGTPRGAQRPGMGLDFFNRFGIKLTQSQKDVLGPQIEEDWRRICEIRQNPELSTAQKNNRLTAVHARRTQQIRDTLTPDQWQIYIKHMSSRRR